MLVTACASLALLGGTAVFAPTASAANSTPGCVTKSEYKKAKKGMTKKRVATIFGTNGKLEARATSGGYASEIRSYRTCSKYSAVAISFAKKPGGTPRLSAKSAVWVS
jgi:hypothetical protein